ncbi:uncharacterized protein UTRI_10433_B [Ustilago trichophora]|uniref:Uncharacterized protein n=1 Tax=Ustilago trichophora TaxID=86804 RepID=A0A5C3EBH0_9BASI|nr:uncharacterized protein UTRI_10433_B [Ustilago trichophora]
MSTIRFLLGLAATAFLLASAQMDDFDKVNWAKAVEVYKKNHFRGLFQSFRSNLATYAKVPDLEDKALEHAKTYGVIPVASYTAEESTAAKGSPSAKVYFLSAIQPPQSLHQEMAKDTFLHDQNVLAFWKYENDKFHLLQMDTLGSQVTEWPLQRLKDVLKLP